MSLNPETYIQRRIMKFLRSRGFYVIRMNPDNGAGIPDLMCIDPFGMSVFVEVKTPKGKITKLQEATMKKLSDNGATVFVARSVDDVQTTLGL